MEFTLEPGLAREIDGHYEEAMAGCPGKKAEVDAFCASLRENEAACLKFLYTYMSVNDLVSYDVETIFHYVRATLNMYEKLDYAREVPQSLFLTYVLSCRVNNESLDESRETLFDMLYPRVRGMSMTEAALEVNYFCYEKATYTPTDDRTLAPLGIMKAARGRCGEESTFTVSALRAVGIPARQCYCPRWAHCDDNHAWVEVWADGAWHYMGACEPEPVLNKGWFTAAASKAMLVHSKAWSHFLPGEDVAYKTPIYALVNSTPVYGPCKTVSVRILDGGVPKKGVEVHFQLVNYSELYSIYRAATDEGGIASFTTGLGDVYIYAQDQGRVVTYQLDVRQEDAVTLDLKEGFRPEELTGAVTEDFEMIPPREAAPGPRREADWETHQARFSACGALREEYEKTFSAEPFLREARGNQEEIRSFLEDPRFAREDKVQLLATLREKDFVDISAETLASYLEASLPYKNSFPEEIYVPWILAPRIADERIAPTRGRIAEHLKGEDLRDGAQVWDYLRKNIRILPSFGADNFTADAYGMLRYGVGSEASFPVLFVAACRSLGIPARLNPVTGAPEYVRMRGENAEFIPISGGEGGNLPETASLTLVNEGGQPLRYNYQFSLGMFQKGEYRTLNYFGLELKDSITWNLARGSYRLLTAARQIDGSVSARATYFHLNGDMSLAVTLCQDKTGEKLRRVPIRDISLGETTLREAMGEGKSVLLFADPGMEPTEHLFRELLECREDYNAAGHKILILLEKPSGNPTLRRVLEALPRAEVFCLRDPEYLRRLHVDMGVGDERLPFAVAADENQNGLFAFANYNIGTAQTLLNILESRQGMEN